MTRGSRKGSGPDREGLTVTTLTQANRKPDDDQPSTQDDRPIGVDDATAWITSLALTDQDVGAVGLEIEGHVVPLGHPHQHADFTTVSRIADELSVLPSGGRTTLEPGGQLEVSSAVQSDLSAAIAVTADDVAVLRARLAEDRLGWAFLGADPLRAPRRLNPAPRYACMEAWFVADGCRLHGETMMCSTAALQINLQAGRPDQWAERVGRAQRMGPLLTALSGTSTYLGGQDTQWRSSRQRAWSGLDPLLSGALYDTDDPAGAWATRALAAPVIHVPDADGVHCADRRRSLREWLADPADWPRPTYADVRRHLTTIFPPVRLRGWLELRCLDSVPDRWWPAICAVTVAWMDDESLHPVVDEALAPVSNRWEQAARLGLADPPLADAAATCLAAAADAVPAHLSPGVDDLHAFALRRSTPGSLIADDIRHHGPAAVLQELTRV